MQCEEIRTYFADHLIGGLGASVEAAVQAHLAACSECRKELAECESMQAMLRAVPLEPLNAVAMRARFDELVHSTIVTTSKGSKKWWTRSRPVQVAFAMMLLAAAVFAAQKTGVWVAVSSMVPLQSTPQSTRALKAAVPAARTGVLTGRVVRSILGEPASGVRVAVMPVANGDGAGNRGAIELARSVVSGSDGRYRLEDIPPGLYYVVAGSVDVPTFYPNTTVESLASVFAVKAGDAIDGIDFSMFQPARPSAAQLATSPPAPPTLVSGVIQYADGTPAAGLPVFAVPVDVAPDLQVDSAAFVASDFLSTATTFRAQYQELRSRLMKPGYRRSLVEPGTTDEAGHYQLRIAVPDVYYIAAGFADSPAYFPGARNLPDAKGISVVSGMNVDAIDFKASPPPAGVAIRGKLVVSPGTIIADGSVELRNTKSSVSLLPPRPYRKVKVSGDGSFEIQDVTSGTFTIEARLRGASPVQRDIVVNDRPVSGLQFQFPVANIAGKIVMEDGSAVSDPQLGEIEITSVSNPNIVLTTALKIDRDGGFRDVFNADEYRLRISLFSQDYVIRSVQLGKKDLLKETFEVRNGVPVDVEIRVARKDGTGPGIRGTVTNGTTGALTTADRVQLCCFPSGPAERVFTAIQRDGSFEFTGLPPQHVMAELRGRSRFVVANPDINVTSAGVSSVKLQSVSPLVPATVDLNFAASERVPDISGVSVVFTELYGSFRAVAVPVHSNPIQVRSPSNVALPANVDYTINVLNLPAGFVVQSIRSSEIGSFERPQEGTVNNLMNGGRLPAFSDLTRVRPNSAFVILITLKRN